jgi:membrane peptidoglycan carboxypeptidase
MSTPRRGSQSWKWLVLAALAVSAGTGTLFYTWSRSLPDVGRLGNLEALAGIAPSPLRPLPEPPGSAERRDLPVALPDIAPYAVAAVVWSEDRRFYQHPGFDLRSLVRSLFATLVQGRQQGGSTITAQLVRSTLLTPDKTLERKFRELILSYRVERRYNKSEILAGYLNTVYWGGTVSGIRAASEAYFGKPPADLTLAEGVYLAALLPAPNARYAHLAQTRREMRVRLDGMAREGLITRLQAHQAWLEPLQPRGWQAHYDRRGNLTEARLLEAQAGVPTRSRL